MVAIGAARDSGDLVVQAITIPLAVLVMAVLTGAMIPAVRRRVQVHSAAQPGARGAAAIFGLILLVNGVIPGHRGQPERGPLPLSRHYRPPPPELL